VEFEPTIAVLERAKTFRALDRSTTAIGKQQQEIKKVIHGINGFIIFF
jgi:hypothetical protein